MERLLRGSRGSNPANENGVLSAGGRDPFPEKWPYLEYKEVMGFSTEVRPTDDASIVPQAKGNHSNNIDLNMGAKSCCKAEPPHAHLVLETRDTDEKEIQDPIELHGWQVGNPLPDEALVGVLHDPEETDHEVAGGVSIQHVVLLVGLQGGRGRGGCRGRSE